MKFYKSEKKDDCAYQVLNTLLQPKKQLVADGRPISMHNIFKLLTNISEKYSFRIEIGGGFGLHSEYVRNYINHLRNFMLKSEIDSVTLVVGVEDQEGGNHIIGFKLSKNDVSLSKILLIDTSLNDKIEYISLKEFLMRYKPFYFLSILEEKSYYQYEV